MAELPLPRCRYVATIKWCHRRRQLADRESLIAYLDAANNGTGLPNVALTKAGGGLGIVAGFTAWYIMLAGIADPSNSFVIIPVVHFPWSEAGREAKNANRVEDNSDNV